VQKLSLEAKLPVDAGGLRRSINLNQRFLKQSIAFWHTITTGLQELSGMMLAWSW
jgi:hypothetical protein